MRPNPFLYGWRDIPTVLFGVAFHIAFWPLRKWGKEG